MSFLHFLIKNFFRGVDDEFLEHHDDIRGMFAPFSCQREVDVALVVEAASGTLFLNSVRVLGKKLTSCIFECESKRSDDLGQELQMGPRVAKTVKLARSAPLSQCLQAW